MHLYTSHVCNKNPQIAEILKDLNNFELNISCDVSCNKHIADMCVIYIYNQVRPLNSKWTYFNSKKDISSSSSCKKGTVWQVFMLQQCLVFHSPLGWISYCSKTSWTVKYYVVLRGTRWKNQIQTWDKLTERVLLNKPKNDRKKSINNGWETKRREFNAETKILTNRKKILKKCSNKTGFAWILKSFDES